MLFDIPDSWEWARLKSFCLDIFSGKSPKYEKAETEFRIIGQAANQQSGLDYSQVKYTNKDFWCSMDERYFLRENDVILNTLGNGTLGRSGIIEALDYPILTDGHLFVFRTVFPVSSWYLYLFLQQRKEEIEKTASGSTNQTFLSLSSTMEWVIPVPPLSEQERIVAKYRSVLSSLESYDAAYVRVEELNASFPEMLKKSILQMAVQGKLVPQDPSDEPASVLLERIHAEKERLIKEGKIKRNKNEAVIFRRDNSHYEKRDIITVCIDEEIPFDIPETWTWCRLSSLLMKTSTGPFGSMLHKEDYTQNGIPLINPANIINGQISEIGIKHVSNSTAQRLSSYRLDVGDVVIGRRGEMGRSAVIKQKHDHWLCGTGCFYVTTGEGFIPDYLVFLLKAPYLQSALLEKSVGTTMNNLNHSILSELLIPLPPVPEQIRIMKEYEYVCSLLPS